MEPEEVISVRMGDLQDVTTLILREYPIYQRDDWDPSSLDDKDETNLMISIRCISME